MKKRQQIVLVIVAALAFMLTAIWLIRWQTNDSTSTQTAVTPQNANSLTIKEWNVRLPLTPAIADAYYTYDASSDEVFLSTKQLDTLLSHIEGCSSGLHGLYYKKTASQLPLTEQLHVEPLCAVPVSSETEQIGSVQSSIRAAVQATFAD